MVREYGVILYTRNPETFVQVVHGYIFLNDKKFRKSPAHLHICPSTGVILMMNRAFNPEKNSQSAHLAQPANLCFVAPRANHVLAVTSKHGNVDFIVGFCRSAVLRRGEIHCLDGFRRGSDPAMENSWAQPLEFTPEPLDRRGIYPVPVADWMTHSRNTGKQP